ncbi:MAG: chemotaxis protein CheW [Eubacteriales bacterium]
MSTNELFQSEPYDAVEEHEVPEIDQTKYLIFLSDGLMFGVDANSVVEIITTHAITALPMVPSYVSGIINLRGLIVPIIDIRLRLGKPSKPDCCIIVLNVFGTQVGILVDQMDRMVDVENSTVLPVPKQNTEKMISGMSSLPDGGTMLVLDCDLLIHD